VRVDCTAREHQRSGANHEPPANKNEHIHGVGKQGDPKDHGERPLPQNEIDAAGRQDADAQREDELHCHLSLSCSAANASRLLTPPNSERTRSAAPTTTRYTPRSNSIADASSISPMSGRCT